MYEKEIYEIEENYKKWLLWNCEDNIDIFIERKRDLLKYRCGEFDINMSKNNEYNSIDLGYKNNENFEKVGATIIYKENENEKYDISLLLLYIAERLDEADRNAPAFQQRGNRYFFRKTKKFISEIIMK